VSLVAIIPVYNEEAVIGDCIESLLVAGILSIFCLDGAWRGGHRGEHVFAGAKEPQSSDATREVVEAAGAVFVPCSGFWPSQEAKRTALFFCGDAAEGDHLLVLDADERCVGRFEEALEPGEPYNVLSRCIGPNDLPGIRGQWPSGDYSPDYIPCNHVFPYDRSLECLYPGGYLLRGEMIRPYLGPEGESALPVLASIRKDHYGNLRTPEQKAAKKAYYMAEHPQRQAWQEAIEKAWAE
jgi:glycosyltransferase involved in cell wall biosynthesis